MSAEATAWVWKHSPFKGGKLAAHLAIADVVNHTYGYEFWMGIDGLSKMLRQSRRSTIDVLDEFVKAGCLEVLDVGGGRGKHTRYRFLFPELPAIYAPRESVQPAHQTVQSAPETVQKPVAQLVDEHNNTTNSETAQKLHLLENPMPTEHEAEIGRQGAHRALVALGSRQ